MLASDFKGTVVPEASPAAARDYQARNLTSLDSGVYNELRGLVYSFRPGLPFSADAGKRH